MNQKLTQSRRNFIRNSSLLIGGLLLLSVGNLTAITNSQAQEPVNNIPQTILSDSRLNLKFGKERMVLNDGLQPSMLATRKGTLIVQGQLSKKPLPQERIFYPYALSTVVSRDGGKKWTEFPLKTGDNGVNMEGGIIQLRDKTILAFETYVTPGKNPDEGIGLMWRSTDDYRTLQGPEEITFNIPEADFYGTSDDMGRPHAAMRLHRRVLELPNGDLLTTIYGLRKGDNEPAGYAPTMKKTRVMLFRSKNKGRHWDYVSTVAADPKVGTEGFGEAVIAHISNGKHAGRLICMMRTGRELYEAISDDEGISWRNLQPRIFEDIDVYKTGEWAEMFKDVRRKGVLISENPNEFIGAVVDPDLIELRNGVLVAAFGVRIPARANFANPKHPWNGNYLAFSFDQGETWSHVTRLTTGISTTHYMAIEELPKDNHLFVVYDFGYWGGKQGRYIYGRDIKLSFNK